MTTTTPTWLGVNAIGVAAFLVAASQTWVEPEVADVPGASGGGPLVWGLEALSIFVAFVLLNLCALVWVYLIRRHSASRSIGLAAMVSLPVWLIAFAVDHLRHGV